MQNAGFRNKGRKFFTFVSYFHKTTNMNLFRYALNSSCKLIVLTVIGANIFFSSCSNNADEGEEINSPDSASLNSNQVNKVISINGVKALQIGSQVWMEKNLNVTTFNNGDSILEVKTNEEWVKAGKEGKPAWCYYNNDAANENPYGKLYNQAAIHDSRGLAPKGWHIPSDEEWETLMHYYGKEIGKKMNCVQNWKDNLNTDDNFKACPGGHRFDDGFEYIDQSGMYWSSTVNENTQPSYITMLYKASIVFKSEGQKRGGLSVRCIKDN